MNSLIQITQEEIDAYQTKSIKYLEAEFKDDYIFKGNSKNKSKSTLKHPDELVDEMIAMGSQLMDGYNNWLKVAFALCDYQSTWDRIFDYRHDPNKFQSLNIANRNSNGAINIGTFYHFFREAGFEINHPKAKKELKAKLTVEVAKNILTEISDEISKYERIDGEVLENNQFLSDKLPYLIKLWLSTHINILVSPASSGKTSMVTKLREKGKRVLLIVPTIAIIKNKKPKDFVQVYETTNIRDYVGANDSIITTFDKASRLSVNEFNQFDYVIVDEFHLLFTETYRIRAISPLINIIKSAVLKNKNNTLINTTKFVLMSGTPLGEEYLNANVEEQLTRKKTYINHKKRDANFVVCDDYNSSYTSLINNAVKFINKGYRVFIPSNAGEKRINSAVGVIANKIGYTPVYAIYSNNKRDSEESMSINNTSFVRKDNQLLFVTSLGNVGIDINNTEKTVMLVLGSKMSGHKAEQYVNRMRKIDVEVFVYFDSKKVNTKVDELVFDYKLDESEVKLLENSIDSDLYNNQKNDDMLIGYKVDHDKLKLRDYNNNLESFNTNIVCFGGYLKSMGYVVNVLWGEKEDKNITEERKTLLNEQDKLEKECKIRMLEFILSMPEKLTQNFSNDIKRKSGGDNSFICNVLTVENEDIFNIIRGFVKRFVVVKGCFEDLERLQNDMLASNMDFKEINKKLILIEYYAKGGNCFDDELIVSTDSFINLENGKGYLTKVAFEKMLHEFSPKYGNKTYDELEKHHQKNVRDELKDRLEVIYTIKVTGKGVFFKQNITKEWQKETYDYVRELFKFYRPEIEVSFIEKRNRIGLAVGDAVGDAVGKSVGVSYKHITNETIDKINKIANNKGFVTVQNVVDITKLTFVSVGKFIKQKLPHLKQKRKTVNKIKQTIYVPDIIIM